VPAGLTAGPWNPLVSRKERLMKHRPILAALAVSLASVLPASAQQASQPITWVAYAMVKPGQTQAAVALAQKYDAPYLDKLLADGTISSWGIATPINHEAGFKWNLLTWVTLPNWANADKWLGAIMQQMGSRSADQNKAIEAEYQAVYAERSHFDDVMRNIVMSSPTQGGAPPRFILAGMYKAKPGQEQAGEKSFAPWWPIVDKLKAEGKVIAYGLQSQDLHTDPAFTYRDWYMLPDLSAVDAINAAAQTGWTAQNQAAFEAAFEGEAHRDLILMILHLGGQAGR
jgi:hypothetical protein